MKRARPKPGANKSQAVGVIPARWGSTRFPGKSLALIGGRPLIEWVVRQALKARQLAAVWVATDNERIRAAVERIGCEAVMTRSDHPSGTDRIAEAVSGRSADIVINIQGDEPMVDPDLIDNLAECLRGDEAWDMATAACPIEEEKDIRAPSVVKVVMDARGQALYFSRAPIPFVRDADGRGFANLYWRHIGLYGYRRDFLQRLVEEPPCAMEQAEKLEQLRALYLGARVKVLRVSAAGLGVDVPDDVARVEAAMRAAGWI
jgi:3-deoxy-manno-octulosonate cytidylyltransferase (CMP-KDO synthetase)